MENSEVLKMEHAEVISFSKPDEVREFPKGRLELVKIGGVTVGGQLYNQVGDGQNR